MRLRNLRFFPTNQYRCLSWSNYQIPHRQVRPAPDNADPAFRPSEIGMFVEGGKPFAHQHRNELNKLSITPRGSMNARASLWKYILGARTGNPSIVCNSISQVLAIRLGE